jgi:hypothetical protein
MQLRYFEGNEKKVSYLMSLLADLSMAELMQLAYLV